MKRIAIVDLETDPFAYGQMIQPFASGFYDGERYVSFWSDDCVKRMVDFLATIEEPLIIYIHNGGRFDLFYFLKHIRHREMKIINNRIVQCWIGEHEIRDSFAIIPMSLEKANKKTPIDYDKFKRDVRESHRQEIIDYLGDDCKFLYELVTAFFDEFGDKLTIGGTALRELRTYYPFVRADKGYDTAFRSQYYAGGRNQVLQGGVMRGDWKVYDVNSMYPFVMRNYSHPFGVDVEVSDELTPQTCFLSVTGRNYNALPARNKKGGLDFNIEHGCFFTSIHEYSVAVELGLFKPEVIHECLNWTEQTDFQQFVDVYYEKRLTAKAKGDKIHEIFYKLILNSAYGKFAQNPDNYKDWYLTDTITRPPSWHNCDSRCDGECTLRWVPSLVFGDEYIIWSRGILNRNYFNVATGASITGAARSILMRGLHGAIEPVYCDTDSIICKQLNNVPIDADTLGAWKLECEGDEIAIGGKKLYALFKNGAVVKKAHKGARITGQQIREAAMGQTVQSFNPVPTFKWDGSYSFIKRNIRSTIKNEP